MPHFHDSLKYLVNRDGTSQRQRISAGLDPSSVKLDERKLEDFLVFIMEYSKKVNFIDLNNSPKGTWEGFWNSEPSMVIASITKTNPLPIKLAFDKISTKTPEVEGVKKSIDNILEIARKIDYWLFSIRRGSSLHTEIRRLIMSNFQGFLHELANLEKSTDTYLEGYVWYDESKYLGFSAEWGFDIAYGKPKANINLLIPTSPIGAENEHICRKNLPVPEKLKAAYSLLKIHFTIIYNVYFQIVQLSAHHFEESLNRADHPPHIALFISFLKLFLKAQENLNQMTKRHLDFFYQTVLGLKQKEAIPDKAHLLVELAKNRLEHSLNGGLRFRAGKDEEGNDLFYAMDKTLVFNKAKVETLKTLFFEQTEISKSMKRVGIKAAPVANSEDGLGLPIQDNENPTWFTMGSTTMPDGNIGFAVASKELLVKEGIRTIILYVYTNLKVEVTKNTFFVYLSGEGEWITLHDLSNFSVSKLEENGFKISVQLDPDTSPILPFDPEQFGEQLGTSHPVMKVILNTKASGFSTNFPELLDLSIKEISLEVNVKGLTQVIGYNDEGRLDTSQPFLPFTPIPKVGSSLYLGHPDVFQKNLKEINFHLTWENRPPDLIEYYAGYDDDVGTDFTIKAFSISEKNRQPLNFSINGNQEDIATILSAAQEEFWFVKNNANKIGNLISGKKASNYGTVDKAGFIQLDLLNSFGHSQYQQVLSRQMLAIARFPSRIIGAWYRDDKGELVKADSSTTIGNNFEVVVPNPPLAPSVKSLTLDYHSQSNANIEDGEGEIEFIHIHPFENSYQLIEQIKDSPLLPQFKNPKSITEKNVLIPEAGALMIGIRDLQPGQSLSLLFQLVENTADAELSKPNVSWHYLKSNQWEPFRESQVANDTTDELLRAGIVELAIPQDINKENTILPSDLHWIKASVTENPKAISHAVGIHAQAALVTFEDNENLLHHLEAPLPAESISKLENDDAAVKGVTQSYDSFGGRPRESDLSFYTRVSEHLRHKGRAITLYDYERLILEEFPEIYKVRCVNHTDDTFHLCPGNVIISVVPDFSLLKAVDRRQPKVSLGQLEKVRRFLEDRNCAFVGKFPNNTNWKKPTIHLRNPIYEKVKINFKVRFLPEVTSVEFHIEHLKKAIVRFLSPWAFEDSADITFGGNVYKSVILHFVERLPYVEYVKDFRMMHDDSSEDTNTISSKTPISILVPVVEEEMTIQNIQDEECMSDKQKLSIGLGHENLEDTKIHL